VSVVAEQHASEPVRTLSWQDPAATARAGSELAGLEYIRALADGRLLPPPIVQLLGFEVVEAQEGRVVFALRPAEWMYNPLGTVHGGVAATMLDTCMGCAVHTTLPQGVGYATTDLQVRYIRAMGSATGRVLTEGRVLHAGKRTAIAEGRVSAELDGRLIAHATTGCAIFA
jgi:uncharacterized protein (TIGR00369 family)